MTGILIEEVFVLNRALDGKGIVGLPMFKEIGGSELLIGDIKTRLISKEILENASSFTMKGVQIVKQIKDYKEAEKYISLSELFIGLKDNSNAIAIIKSGDPAEYKFIPVDIKDSYWKLCALYPFLSLMPTEREAQRFEYSELEEKYGSHVKETLTISTFSDKGKELTSELLFALDGRLHLYDRREGVLAGSFPRAEVFIKERMSLI